MHQNNMKTDIRNMFSIRGTMEAT